MVTLASLCSNLAVKKEYEKEYAPATPRYWRNFLCCRRSRHVSSAHRNIMIPVKFISTAYAVVTWAQE